MKNYFKYLVCLALICLINSCGTLNLNEIEAKDSFNDWLEKNKTIYDSSVYLTTTGTSFSPEDAEARGRINIAEIFSVVVSGQTTSYSLYDTRFTGETDSTKSFFADNITSQTSEEIEGSQVVDIYFDSSQSTYTAFIALQRSTAERSLMIQREDKDQEILDLLDDLKQIDNKLLRVKNLYEVSLLLLEQEQINKKLRVIAHRNVIDSAFEPIYFYKDLIDETLAQTSFSLVSNFGHEDDLLRILARNGLTFFSNSGEFLFNFVASKEDPFEYDGKYWQRASFSMDVVDQQTQRILSSSSWKIKSNSDNQDSLDSQINRKIIDTLTDEVLLGLILGIKEDV